MKEPVLFKDLTSFDRKSPILLQSKLGQVQSFFYQEILKPGSDFLIEAQSNTELEAVFFQNASLDADLYTEIQVKASKNSKVKLTFIQEGGSKSEVRIQAECLGENAEIEVMGLQNAKNRQKFLFKADAIHGVPHTRSDLKVWCVARDESHSIFNALITIEKGAHHTEAYQKNKNLLLSEKATIDTFPKLLIANDEVKCAHGSSTSTLEPDQAYYLQSRGISAQDAEQMLVKGFLSQALDQVSDVKVLKMLKEKLGIHDEEDFL